MLLTMYAEVKPANSMVTANTTKYINMVLVLLRTSGS